MKKGRLIVIEGTDGSGKATQMKILENKLKKNGHKVKTADFPQYGKPSSYFAEKYLRGEYGTASDVGPYAGSMFYALDRYDKSFEMRKWLEEGYIVICNRYVSANMGHQAGKIKSRKERERFLEWLSDLEYKIFSIPKPDMTLLLFMPPVLAQGLVDGKAPREYISGKKRDIHEADIDHLNKASEAYLAVAKKYKWKILECTKNGSLLPREEIHEKILKAISSII